jgi:sugar phosphate permease
MGLGGVVVPRLSNWLIEAYGWRVGYVGLGLVSLCVTLPLVVALLRDSPEAMGQRPDGDAPERGEGAGRGSAAEGGAVAVTGLDVREALRQPTMWLLIVAFAVLGIAIGGVMVPLVPILEDRGLARSDAIAIAGLLGISLVVGRIVAGALMDRFHAPYVAVGFLLGPIVGLSLLASGVSGPAAYAAAILIGLAAGAEVDVIAYMVGRYFGTRSYATLYGVLYSAWTFGSGFGPLASATSFDRMGSYGPALAAYVVAMAVACVLLLRLGPYPRFDARSVEPVAAAAAAVR